MTGRGKMRIHYIQHVPFETLAGIETQLLSRGHEISGTKIYEDCNLPSYDEFDWLIVMGGPMGVYDLEVCPWLAKEKVFIKGAIDHNKIVLGICLGAQLIADVLGARVFQNEHREIGWFDIARNGGVLQTQLGKIWPERMQVFHWHGDTFDIPTGAIHLAKSEACQNQAFLFGDRVLGLQFHLETTKQSASALIKHCGNELDGSFYVQSADEIIGEDRRFDAINELMASIIDILQDIKP